MTVSESKKCLDLLCNTLKLTVETVIEHYDVPFSGERKVIDDYACDSCKFTIARAELKQKHLQLHIRNLDVVSSWPVFVTNRTLNGALILLCEKINGVTLVTTDKDDADHIDIPEFGSYEELKLKLTVAGKI